MKAWISRHRWMFLVVAGLTALLVLAACGDDDEDEPPVATDVPAATDVMLEAPCEGGPGVTNAGAVGGVSASRLQDGENLKIGLLMPSTGGLAAYGPTIANGALLAAKCINNAGGVNGAEVELIELDTESLAEPAIAAAEQLLNVDSVVAFVGPAGTDATLGVASSVAIPNETLLITPSTTGPVLSTLDDNDYVFRTTISDAAQGLVLADVIENDLGFSSVCTMYVNNAYGQGLTDNFVAAYGGEVTAEVSHEEAGVTFLSELDLCLAGEPEALVAMSYTTGQADVYLREAIENGLIDTFVFVDGTKDAELFAELGWENFEGLTGTAPGALGSDSGVTFLDMYVAEYGEAPTIPFVAEAFDAVVSIALAAQAAGTNTDSTAIRDSLRDVANAPGSTYGPSEEDITAALADVAAGVDVDYIGGTGSVEFDDVGDVTFGAIDVWRVIDEAIETIRTVSVNLETGVVETISD